MKKLFSLTVGLLLFVLAEGQTLRHPFYVAPQVQESGGVPSFLSTDGYTVGWYIASETSTLTITEWEGNNYVDAWRDYLGSGNDLDEFMNMTPEPVGGRIHFDPARGENNMLKGPFTFNQPEEIWIVGTQASWYSGATLFDGYTADGRIRQNDTSPGLKASAGNYSSQNNNMALSTPAIIRVVFNTTSSEFQINNTSTITWSAGSANMGGFTIGNVRGGGVPADIYIDEIILRNSISDESMKTAIYNYLSAKYSIE